MRLVPALPLAITAALLTGACAYDGVTGYAPTGYPDGYDSGMGSGLTTQPGDLFGGRNVESIAVFEAPLAGYGQWVNSRFGRAFRPDAPQDWRPYVNGQWGENRLWVSGDPWGWATDHYGRWGFDEQIGWVWVPGTEWAPSWVAFRDDPQQNVTGWAPVPPGVNYSVGIGTGWGVGGGYGFGSGWGYDNFSSWYAPSWVWVPRSYVYQPGFGGRVLPWRYGATYWGGSRWQYQPSYQGRPSGLRPGVQYQARPPQGGQYQGRPPQGGQFQGRPPQGGQYQSRPDNQGIPGFRPFQPGGDRSQARPERAQTMPQSRPAAEPRPQRESYRAAERSYPQERAPRGGGMRGNVQPQ